MIQEYEYYQDVRQDKVARRTFIWFVVILACFFSLIFVTNVLFQNNYRYITVNGTSMQPTINANPIQIKGKAVQDGVYIKLLKDRGINELSYGDIIIIGKTEETTIIKRYLAKEGDKISILKVSVDGGEQYRFVRIKSGSSVPEVIEEDYLSGLADTGNYGIIEEYGYERWSKIPSISLSSNKYETYFYDTFLNPDSEIYSEIYYPSYVPYSQAVSTYSVQYDGQTYNNVLFYEVPRNNIYYMGDNRLHSQDARVTGTKEVSKVVGKVVKITRNSTSSKNSIFWLFSRVKGYFEIVWDEIVNYFAWKA